MKSGPDHAAQSAASEIDSPLSGIGLAAAIDQAGQAVIIADRDGNILYVNAAFTKMTGYSSEEVMGRNPRLLKSGKQDARYYRDLWETISAGRNWHGKLINRRKDGSVYTEEMTIAPVLDPEGNIARYVALKQDVTERCESEERSRFLAAIVESSPDAISGITLDGTISAWNAGAEVLYGYRAGEVIGKSVSIIVPPSRSAEKPQILDIIMGGKTLSQFETVRITKDGRSIDVSLTVSPIKDIAGRIVGAATIGRDISERKRAEAIVREAKEAAEAANRAKSEFLANMSHEVRTPMNGVIGMTGLLLETELTDKQRRYMKIVRSSGQSLLRVINDILDFSKIEAHKLELEIVDFDLRAALEDATVSLRARALEKGLELVCLIELEVPLRLRGDSGRLRQILLNLAGNAVKFTSRGHVTIRACLDREDERSAVIRFSVEDTGIGISADRQAFIFSPFTQVDGSTTRKYGGTGLGLAISKQLTELLGGEIGVESAPGKGSTFWFTAAFEKQPEDSLSYAQKARAQTADDEGNTGRLPGPGPLSTTWKRGARILVAEDNVTSQEVALAILEKLGCRADAVANGQEALESLRSIPYDLVLMDCQMPEMNGYEAAARIRSPQGAVRNPQIPIVAMTAHAMKGDREKCLAAGMNDYIAKPVDPLTLAAVIGKWLPQDAGSFPACAIAESPARTAEPRAAFAPVFDEASLLERLMGDLDLARTVVGSFLEDIPKQLASLESHLAAGDAAAAVRQAHSIRGAAATVSSVALQNVAREIEQAGRVGDLRAMSVRLRELERQFQETRKAMESMGGAQAQRKRTLS